MVAQRAGFSFVATCVLPVFLSACSGGVDPTATASLPPQARTSILPSGLSPRPAALAVTQMDAPEPQKTQFMALFNADVARQDVALTDSADARYLARGYISAYPVEGGARLTYVWDIYDRTAHRAQRLNDEIALQGTATDPWGLVDASALTTLAQRSAGELAAYLSNTPEAMAAAQPADATASSPALSYAPVR